MLCTECGVDIGDKQGLCEECEAFHEGTAIDATSAEARLAAYERRQSKKTRAAKRHSPSARLSLGNIYVLLGTTAIAFLSSLSFLLYTGRSVETCFYLTALICLSFLVFYSLAVLWSLLFYINRGFGIVCLFIPVAIYSVLFISPRDARQPFVFHIVMLLALGLIYFFSSDAQVVEVYKLLGLTKEGTESDQFQYLGDVIEKTTYY